MRPATRAIMAFGEGRYGDAVRLLRAVRNTAQRFGGSHAQRDLLDLTLIEAAFFEGYTQSELAAKFGLPLGTVKTRLRRGMQQMREQLQHLGR